MLHINKSLISIQSPDFQPSLQLSATDARNETKRNYYFYFSIYKYLCDQNSNFNILPRRIVRRISDIFSSIFTFNPVLEPSEFHFLQDEKINSRFQVALYKGKKVAIKKFPQITDRDLKTFQEEAEECFYFQHPNVLKIVGHTNKKDNLQQVYLATEKMESNLYDYLRATEPQPQQRLHILSGIAQGLCYLHRFNFVHRRIRSRNILLDTQLNPKLKSLGFNQLRSCSRTVNHFNQNKSQTVRYRAPEAFARRYTPHPPADIYGFGMIVWETVVRRDPYMGKTEKEAYDLIEKGTKEVVPENCPLYLKDLIHQCWAPSDTRLTSSEIVGKLRLIQTGEDNLEAHVPIKVRT